MPAAVHPAKRLLAGYVENPESGCWDWVGTLARNGYGRIKVFGRQRIAHRYSYELHCGPIPDDLEIMHSCDNRRCINPGHMRLGTHAENMREAAERKRMPSGSAHPFFGIRQERPKQSNIVRVHGAIYQSQKAAERALGLGCGTVLYWLRSHPEKAQLIARGAA